MKVDRRRLARGIAVAVIGLFLAVGIIYIGHDVAVRPPVSPALLEPAPADTAARRAPASKTHADSTKKKSKKKEAAQPRRPQQRDFLNEPVNR